MRELITKASKASVDYSRAKPDGNRCDECRHFLARDHKCRKVASQGSPTPGSIDPAFWCKLWKGKK